MSLYRSPRQVSNVLYTNPSRTLVPTFVPTAMKECSSHTSMVRNGQPRPYVVVTPATNRA